jgi:hypothetical protein
VPVNENVKSRRVACAAAGCIRPIRPAPSRVNICFFIIPPFPPDGGGRRRAGLRDPARRRPEGSRGIVWARLFDVVRHFLNWHCDQPQGVAHETRLSATRLSRPLRSVASLIQPTIGRAL